MKKLEYGENDCTNLEYHSDRVWLNSSALKYLMHGWENYEKNYLKREPKKTNSNYEVGSLMHSLLLEPHNTKRDFAIYNGPTRQGKRFKEFKSQHPNKIIITRKTFQKINTIVKSYKRRKSFRKIFTKGLKEHTVCAWVKGIRVKARFDCIDVENGRIFDLKSSRYSRSEYGYFISDSLKFNYNLSAAFYIAVAESFYKRKFEFTLVALDKRYGDHFYHSYRFAQEELKLGRENMFKALKNYKK